MAVFAWAAVVLGADLFSKWLVLEYLRPIEPITVMGLVDLHVVFNPGVAFGLLAGHIVLPVVTSTIVIVVVLAYGLRTPGLARVSAGLVAGGSMGNLVDRLRYQAVVDFIDLRFWPVFNVADTALVVGMLVLAWTLVRSGRETEGSRCDR